MTVSRKELENAWPVFWEFGLSNYKGVQAHGATRGSGGVHGPRGVILVVRLTQLRLMLREPMAALTGSEFLARGRGVNASRIYWSVSLACTVLH